jgi:predicted ATPase
MNVTAAHLPPGSSPLIDRQEDLAALSALLVDGQTRLLTITGPAGVGKTRLVLALGRAVADHFPDGVAFVDLASVRDPASVLGAIAANLAADTVPETAAALQTLKARLHDRAMLMILDNFEQVLSAARYLTELSEAAPLVTFLVTSRAPLQLHWEQLYHLQPLEVPKPEALPPLEDLARIHSVALFLQRAQAINQNFALTERNARAVAELMVRLDGLPLAIELAAARIRFLTPQMILERLGQRLSILRWGAQDLPERQQTLDSALAWSYDLLSSTEQAVFRRLGAFAGGFTLEEAEAVVEPLENDPLDILASLVSKSLVQVRQSEQEAARYILLETIREYALEQLEAAGEREEAERLVAEVCARVPEECRDLEAAAETAVPAFAYEVAPRKDNLSILSPREHEALHLVAEGLSNKQIAKQLLVTENTAKSFVTGVFNKLGVNTRAHAVAVGVHRGLLQSVISMDRRVA